MARVVLDVKEVVKAMLGSKAAIRGLSVKEYLLRSVGLLSVERNEAVKK